MKIAVVGAGHLGRPLAEWLAGAGHDVLALARYSFFSHPQPAISPGPRLVSVPDFEDLERELQVFSPEAMVVCWAPGSRDPQDYRRVYVEGMERLMTRDFPDLRHAVYTSSTSVYEDLEGKVDESARLAPRGEHARLLLEAENIFKSGMERLGVAGCILRLAGLYSADRPPARASLQKGVPLQGHPGDLVNLLHREDAARALALALEKRLCGVFNLADGHPIRREELYVAAAKAFGLPPPIWNSPVAENTREREITPAKFAAATGWRPEHEAAQLGL